MRFAQHRRDLFDRPGRSGSELLWRVIARMPSCLSLSPIVSPSKGADTAFVVVSEHTDSGSGSIVPALASPRPLTAVCG